MVGKRNKPIFPDRLFYLLESQHFLLFMIKIILVVDNNGNHPELKDFFICAVFCLSKPYLLGIYNSAISYGGISINKQVLLITIPETKILVCF